MDVLTMIAASTAAWALVDVLHEVVGHGGAVVLLVISVRAVSTTTIFADWDQVQSMAEVRAIHASATPLGPVTAGLALLALRSPRVTSPATRYFLWVFATISLVIVTLNLVAGADWSWSSKAWNRQVCGVPGFSPGASSSRSSTTCSR